MRLAGKTVVVIGGGSGIGFACAEAAAREGASVVIAGRSVESLEKAKARLTDGARAVPADVSDENSVRELFGGLESLDHLIVTAAETKAANVAQSEVEEIRPTLESRVWGGYFAAKHAASRMRDGASITLFSGLSALRPYPGSSVISASTGAVESLSRSLALELAPIRVNAIRPGIIETPLLDGYYGEGREEFLKGLGERLPVGRAGSPEEVAQAAIFLMCNGFVTGTVLQIDGGGSLV